MLDFSNMFPCLLEKGKKIALAAVTLLDAFS